MKVHTKQTVPPQQLDSSDVDKTSETDHFQSLMAKLTSVGRAEESELAEQEQSVNRDQPMVVKQVTADLKANLEVEQKLVQESQPEQPGQQHQPDSEQRQQQQQQQENEEKQQQPENEQEQQLQLASGRHTSDPSMESDGTTGGLTPEDNTDIVSETSDEHVSLQQTIQVTNEVSQGQTDRYQEEELMEEEDKNFNSEENVGHVNNSLVDKLQNESGRDDQVVTLEKMDEDNQPASPNQLSPVMAVSTQQDSVHSCEPPLGGPGLTDPIETEHDPAVPTETDYVPMEPTINECVPTEPTELTEPVETEHVPVEPNETEHVPVEPNETEHVPVEPNETEHVPVEPNETEHVPVELNETEHVAVELNETEHVPVELNETEHVPVEPVETEHEPILLEPFPAREPVITPEDRLLVETVSKESDVDIAVVEAVPETTKAVTSVIDGVILVAEEDN